ncbi:MAG: hypothetical protein JW874_02085, partial [Spirochaetales bacterium]|nr:hypothetical protein [Spirochaetales bacterium]
MKRKSIKAALFFILLLTCRLGIDDDGPTPDLPEYSWQSRGIGGGGGLFCPSISPHNGNIIYMPTDMSAVYQTVDGGAQWETIHYKNLRGGSNSIVRFTSDPAVLYAVNIDDQTGDQIYLKKTTDQGQSWQTLPFGDTVWYMECDPGSTDRLIATTWDDFLFSSDGGESFSPLNAGGIDLTGCVLAGSLWNGDSIFIAYNSGILFSSDGGETFSHPAVGGIPSDEAIISLAAAKEGNTVRFVALTHAADEVYARSSVNSDVIWNFRSIYRLDFTGSWAGLTWQETSHGFLSTE